MSRPYNQLSFEHLPGELLGRFVGYRVITEEDRRQFFDAKCSLMRELMSVACCSKESAAPTLFFEPEFKIWAETEDLLPTNVMIYPGTVDAVHDRHNLASKARMNFVWYYFNPNKTWLIENNKDHWLYLRYLLKYEMKDRYFAFVDNENENLWSYFMRQYRKVKKQELQIKYNIDEELNIRLKTVNRDFKAMVDKYEKNYKLELDEFDKKINRGSVLNGPSIE